MAACAKSSVCALGAATALALLARARVRARREKLAGQVVLITGGSRGFGLALAREFLKLRCSIALCARDHNELEKARQTLGAPESDIFIITCDISDKASVTAAVDAVTSHYGHIDILVNNAGEIMVSPFENLEIADFERAMDVMFWGTLYITRAVLPFMKARGRGRIVNVTSIGGKVSVPHLLSYSCAKAAEVALSNGLRNELRQFGIDVTTIIPGLMRTGSHVNAFFKGDQVAEASWFGAAASLPMLSLGAEHAARLAMNAISAGKTEAVLGLPAQILSAAHALLPGLTADVLRLTNALLPKASAGDSIHTGGELEERHGSFYHLLTIAGKRAGKRLNQPV